MVKKIMHSEKQKLTRWSDGRVKPVRANVYQQRSGFNQVGYQRWDGRDWYGWGQTPEAAAKSPYKACMDFQNDPWRGLAKDPRK